jgi:threonine dehydratase
MDDYLERILKASVYDVAIETPLEEARRLSARLGHTVLFKREDLQPVFSFKLRGAYNRIARLTPEERARGVIASSAGNHAQGVALAAQRLGTRAVIVMPTLTPSIKVQAVEALGAEIVLYGEAYDDAYAEARRRAEAEGLVFIHPFDDPDVIAGQGTIGMEILRQRPHPPDAIFVPIGGGGLMAGIACYVKSLYPEVRLIGVEPEEAASMHAALQAGQPVELAQVGVFADGVAVRRVGDETFRLCQRYVDDMVLVNTDEICAAIRDIFEDTRTLVEPAGALAVAGLKRWLATHPGEDKGRCYVTVNCGANVNFDRLKHIAERADVGEQREALLGVEIPERPGAFLEFCQTLGRRNITEFNYRYAGGQSARIFVGVALVEGMAEKQRLVGTLREHGYAVTDLSDSEVAKLHVRHMVGGPAPGLRDELLFRFQFPERPGALLRFLQAIGDQWNISLFHYRNHGSDYGRVLAGVQVPAADREEFERHLEQLGYAHWDETGNPAYRLFLAQHRVPREP